MFNLLLRLFGWRSSNLDSLPAGHTTSTPCPTPSRSVLAPGLSEPTPDTLQPLKNWCHPFKDRSHPLSQLTQLANAKDGYYPVGRNGQWHGGVHFDGGTATVLNQDGVNCLADGEVVAYRIDEHSPITTYVNKRICVPKPFSRNFVLVRHRLQSPRIKGSTDVPPTMVFYSLYMHLQDWAVYRGAPSIVRPAFWTDRSIYHVNATVNDVLIDQPERRGLNVLNQAHQGKVIGFLPRGAEVAVSGSDEYRTLENTSGPDHLKGADGSLRGYVSIRFLEPINGGQYRVNSRGKLNVRAEGDSHSDVIAKLDRGTEVTVSGDGELRKLEHVNQYVCFKSLQGTREPQAIDRVIVLDEPVAIKAEDLIGHIGLYQCPKEDSPEKKLHLEIFSSDDVESFIEACRAWAQRLPSSEKTWMKLVKGTPVTPHQDNYCATQLPIVTTNCPVSGADLLLPKSLLNGLPDERRIATPINDLGKAYNWYRLDGLLNDANNNILDGWVREEVGVTPWIGPWDWEGYDVVFSYDSPLNKLASLFRDLGQLSVAQLERFREEANEGNKSAVKNRLYDIIDRDRDGKMTAEELQAAISLPAHAQSISRLIIHGESEWFRPEKWDRLDEILGYSSSTPHLNWLAEKKRIKQISWWSEVEEKVGLPMDGKVYHLHPVGLIHCFSHMEALKILAGRITFDAEGNDLPESKHYSRVIHWPGNDLSGVTLGRGYDMGNRTQNEIYAHLSEAGVNEDKSVRISLAYGLKGVAAKEFVKNNKAVIGEITREQQVSLFNIIYPSYVDRAIVIYDKWTGIEAGRVRWEDLDPIIRDILVDFVYQGFTAGPNPMKSGMRNDRVEMISYIENTTAISQYEPGRRRANYLRYN